jgi:hypothetical protein
VFLRQREDYSEGISYLCFLLSEILANQIKIEIPESELRCLLEMARELPLQHRQYPLAVFLTYLYQLPYPVCTFLHQHNIYEGFLN